MVTSYYCPPEVACVTERNMTIVIVDEMPQKVPTNQALILSLCCANPGLVLEELAVMASLKASRLYDPAEVRGLLSSLMERGLVKRSERERRVSQPYPLLHRCLGCGCSCQAQAVGPLSDAEEETVLAAYRKVAADYPENFNPILKTNKKDGSCTKFLNSTGKKCIFLDENNQCRIHLEQGASQKPAACRHFPRAAILTEAEVRLGIKPYCYHAHASVNDVGSQRSMPEPALMEEMMSMAAYRPILRVATGEQVTEALIEEMQVLQWLESDISYPRLIMQLLNLQPKDTLSTKLSSALNLKLKRIPSVVAQTLKEVGETLHGRHLQELVEGLESSTLKPFKKVTLTGEAWDYARYCLHQAVFLREVSRFPSVICGTLAYAIGAWVAASLVSDSDNSDGSDNSKFYQHLTAWFRMISQTQAFLAIFRSPQDYMELSRSAV